MSGAIVLIHGRGPKPSREALLKCWASFLPKDANKLPLDMVHWVDLFGYTPPVQPDSEDCERIAAADILEASAQAAMARASQEVIDLQPRATAWSWDSLLPLRDRVLERLWDQFTNLSGDRFAIDVRNFFRDRPALRDESRDRLRAAIRAARQGGHEVLVLAHSFGTVVAYEAAREFQQREIHTLVTMGGPLAWCYGLWGPAAPPKGRYPTDGPMVFPRQGLRNWWNVYDPRDPVATAKVLAAAPQIAPLYQQLQKPVVIDTPIENTYARPNDPGSPHDYRGYLISRPVQQAIRTFMLETA